MDFNIYYKSPRTLLMLIKHIDIVDNQLIEGLDSKKAILPFVPERYLNEGLFKLRYVVVNVV